jgi:hypothetical protein
LEIISQSGIFVAAAGNDVSIMMNILNILQAMSLIISFQLQRQIITTIWHTFPCYGKRSVDIGAPGVDIMSTVPGNSYESYSVHPCQLHMSQVQ